MHPKPNILFRTLTVNSDKSGLTLAQRRTQGAGGPHVPTSFPLAAPGALQGSEEPHRLRLPELSLTLALYTRCSVLLFTNDQMEAQRSEATCPRSHSPVVTALLPYPQKPCPCFRKRVLAQANKPQEWRPETHGQRPPASQGSGAHREGQDTPGHRQLPSLQASPRPPAVQEPTSMADDSALRAATGRCNFIGPHCM